MVENGLIISNHELGGGRCDESTYKVPNQKNEVPKVIKHKVVKMMME